MRIVEEALRGSKLVVVLCTPASVERRWVFFEAGGAFFLGARVIPVCVGGMHRDHLQAPLSFLQAVNLAEADHLRMLLSEIASLAGLQTPAADFAADATWLATGARPSVATPAAAPGPLPIAWIPVDQKELSEQIAQLPQDVQAAASRALLMFVYMFNTSSLRVSGWGGLASAPKWTRYLVTRLQEAGLPLPTDTAAGKRASVKKINAYLMKLAAREGWTKADALLDLESLLPQAIPFVARDLFIIEALEPGLACGWRITLDLMDLLALHVDPLVPRLIGTLAQHEGFLHTQNDYTSGLLRSAQKALPNDADFKVWFQQVAGEPFEAYRVREREDKRASEERWRRQRELD